MKKLTILLILTFVALLSLLIIFILKKDGFLRVNSVKWPDENSTNSETKYINDSKLQYSFQIPSNWTYSLEPIESKGWVSKNLVTIRTENAELQIMTENYAKSLVDKNETGGQPERITFTFNELEYQYVAKLDNKKIYIDKEPTNYKGRDIYSLYSEFSNDLVTYDMPLWTINNTFDKTVITLSIESNITSDEHSKILDEAKKVVASINKK